MNYINIRNKIEIICPIHGSFIQSPKLHLEGSGCQICALLERTTTQNEFIHKCNIKHKYKYDYSLVKFEKIINKIEIICKKHGLFKQSAASHLNGTGCPTCSSSKGEKQILHYLIENNIVYILQHKFPDCKHINVLSFDFYLPEYNLCIEYNGRQHYESVGYFGGEKTFKYVVKNDQIKKDYCQNNNINLLIIKYDQDINEELDKYFENILYSRNKLLTL